MRIEIEEWMTHFTILWFSAVDVRVHHRGQWGDREIGPRRGPRVLCAHFKAWMNTNARVRPREL